MMKIDRTAAKIGRSMKKRENIYFLAWAWGCPSGFFSAIFTGARSAYALGRDFGVAPENVDKVYAFGHPMYNLGPTEFPMTRAYVHTVLPSLFASMKLSGTADVIGTVTQDRATAIGGPGWACAARGDSRVLVLH